MQGLPVWLNFSWYGYDQSQSHNCRLYRSVFLKRWLIMFYLWWKWIWTRTAISVKSFYILIIWLHKLKMSADRIAVQIELIRWEALHRYLSPPVRTASNRRLFGKPSPYSSNRHYMPWNLYHNQSSQNESRTKPSKTRINKSPTKYECD